MNDINLGKLVMDPTMGRDAVHVAIIPLVAAEPLHPGWHIALNEKGEAICRHPITKGGIGIVDPFLTHHVPRGERFWCCLYPNTITSLRHVWTHPSFAEVSRAKSQEILEQLRKAVRT